MPASPARRGACVLLLIAAAVSGCGSSSEPESEPALSDELREQARSAGPPAPPEFYGVMAQSALGEEDFDEMAAGGVGALRVWFFVDQKPKQGEYDFSTIDPVVSGAASRGIEILPYLFATPEWVTDLDRSDCDPDCAIEAPAEGEPLAAWREFTAAAVERYGPGGEFWEQNPQLEPAPIETWQIWNEQNSPSAFGPKPDVKGYATLLGAAAEEIRAQDPEASIVLGGMFGTPLHGKPPALTAPDFLRRLYAIPGASDDFDGVAVHPYAAQVEKVESQLRAMHEEIERAGDDAGIWVTEFGWSSGDGEDPLERGYEGQAEQLIEAFRLFLEQREEWNIEGVNWYSWRDYTGAEICVWCAHSGLFEEDELVPKPAWEAFTSLPRAGG